MKSKLQYSVVLILLILSASAFALTDNEVAPELSGVEIQSQKAVNLSDYSGKTVLLDFWAAWCAPCRHSLPYLNSLQAELKNNNFIVLGVNLDENPKDAIKFLNRFPVQFPILKNVRKSQISRYQIEAMPMSYLIDKDGKVVKSFVGFKKSELKKIKQWVLTQAQSL